MAESILDRLIAEKEDFWPGHFALGTLFAELGMNGKAIALLKKSLELNPKNDEAMANLAGVYRRLEKKDLSLSWNRKALRIKRTPETLSNLAGAYINEGNPEPALKWADEALAMKPGMAQALNHKALALLEMGRWEEGWAIYDARLDLPQFHRRPFTCPMWDGKPVKKLAIHGEQGLGDEIMFMSLWPALEHLAEEVEIECAARLVKLMQSTFPKARVYSDHDDRAFDPDAYIPMGSLPRLIKPPKKPYLIPSRTYTKLDVRVGLSWKGGTEQTHGKLRNAPVELWGVFKDLQADLMSLQYGPREEEAAALGIPHDSESIADLDTLAAMIESCDLVISVCNTTVHMAGALGVPCIVLVPAKPAWRYGLSGHEMPFYSSCFMVRQGKDEPWESVLARAKAKCADF